MLHRAPDRGPGIFLGRGHPEQLSVRLAGGDGIDRRFHRRIPSSGSPTFDGSRSCSACQYHASDEIGEKCTEFRHHARARRRKSDGSNFRVQFIANGREPFGASRSSTWPAIGDVQSVDATRHVSHGFHIHLGEPDGSALAVAGDELIMRLPLDRC